MAYFPRTILKIIWSKDRILNDIKPLIQLFIFNDMYVEGVSMLVLFEVVFEFCHEERDITGIDLVDMFPEGDDLTS